jgi:hypothetical protein
MISRLKRQNGSVAIFTISFVLVCIIILLALFDLCRIYIARETAKTVSETITLAASQELLYFRPENIIDLAKGISSNNGCRIISLSTGYDEIEVKVERKISFAILGKIELGRFKAVSSSSRTKVIYPWDRRWGNCRYYEFGYKPY